MRDERSLTKGQWERLSELFHHLLQEPPERREALIAVLCAGDADLAHELRYALAGAADSSGATDALLGAGLLPIADGERDLSGRVLGEYRLMRRIDRGGMGVVYRAERTHDGGDVAVKVLLSELGRERFLIEQRLHAQLVHPGIPQFHKSDEHEGTRYFVLEYVEGLRITEHCHRQGSNLGERLRLFRLVCEAVGYAHEVGVLHCDIKPSNILVKADGTTRLLDFGVSTPLAHLSQRLQRDHLSVIAHVAGLTPAYAAPEQLRGGAITLATDVYALGLVLYELLTLRHPFLDDDQALTVSELTRRTCETDPEPPSRVARLTGALEVLGPVREDHWIDLDALVLRALATDPARRIPNVEALLLELKRIELKRARDAATAEAARAARVQRFMVDLMSGGPRGEGHRHGMTVQELLEAAIRAADATVADPLFQAEVLSSAGSSLAALGVLEHALEVLHRARALHERILGPDTPELARDALALGRVHLTRGEYVEAERCARHAIELSARVAEHDYSLRASSATLLGAIFNATNRYREAVAVLEQTRLTLTHAEREPTVESKLISELAGAHHYLGQYEEAERYNLESLALDRAHLSPRHGRIGDTLINLGAIAMDQCRYEDAERLNREALEIIEQFHGELHPTTASAITLWARSLNLLKRYEDALRALDRALALSRRLYAGDHPKIASALHDRFTALIMLDRVDEAERVVHELVALERALHGPEHSRYGHALDRLGSLQLERKQFAQAVATFDDMLAVYLKTLPESHMSVAIAHLKIGRARARAGDLAAGLEHSLRGYEALRVRTPSPAAWLAGGAKDLIATYEALGDPERAAFYRARLLEHEKPTQG